jgi:LacI family transcriptional regulator
MHIPPPPRPPTRSSLTTSAARSVGVVANAYADPYSLRVMHSAVQELANAGMHSICFMGGFPDAPMFRDTGGACVLPAAIDGWLLVSETLRGFSSELDAASRSERPVVSVGLELPAAPSITSNDETGVFQAVAHLAKRHERKRIAFITGPEESVDGARRLSSYRLALESLGLLADPALVVSGDYEASSGREAVRQVRRQAWPFDAVVAANDLMAIGAAEGLKAAGLRVPEDVSVVGFDDMEEAAFAVPTLTTVRQPLQEQGVAAVRLLLRRLQHGAPQEDTDQHRVIVSPLVIRESCGCRTGEPLERRSYPPGVDPDRNQRLVTDALREIVRRELASARVLRELSRLAEGILRAPDYPELAAALTKTVGLLHVRRFLLCTYAGGRRHARAALESAGRDVLFHHQSHPFPIEQLFPAGYLKGENPVQLVVEPLELAGEQLGYLVLEGDVRDGQAYLELRRHLGSSLGRMAHVRDL